MVDEDALIQYKKQSEKFLGVAVAVPEWGAGELDLAEVVGGLLLVADQEGAAAL